MYKQIVCFFFLSILFGSTLTQNVSSCNEYLLCSECNEDPNCEMCAARGVNVCTDKDTCNAVEGVLLTNCQGDICVDGNSYIDVEDPLVTFAFGARVVNRNSSDSIAIVGELCYNFTNSLGNFEDYRNSTLNSDCSEVCATYDPPTECKTAYFRLLAAIVCPNCDENLSTENFNSYTKICDEDCEILLSLCPVPDDEVCDLFGGNSTLGFRDNATTRDEFCSSEPGCRRLLDIETVYELENPCAANETVTETITATITTITETETETETDTDTFESLTDTVEETTTNTFSQFTSTSTSTGDTTTTETGSNSNTETVTEGTTTVNTNTNVLTTTATSTSNQPTTTNNNNPPSNTGSGYVALSFALLSLLACI